MQLVNVIHKNGALMLSASETRDGAWCGLHIVLSGRDEYICSCCGKVIRKGAASFDRDFQCVPGDDFSRIATRWCVSCAFEHESNAALADIREVFKKKLQKFADELSIRWFFYIPKFAYSPKCAKPIQKFGQLHIQYKALIAQGGIS
jgi:hypothetical protein